MTIVGIGVDLCRISRIAKTYARFGDRFLQRAFHPAEIASAKQLTAGRGQASVEQFLASRYTVVLRCIV
jgi:phosphopantetheinyl transferase (holo-ACP synthase)